MKWKFIKSILKITEYYEHAKVNSLFYFERSQQCHTSFDNKNIFFHLLDFPVKYFSTFWSISLLAWSEELYPLISEISSYRNTPAEQSHCSL